MRLLILGLIVFVWNNFFGDFIINLVERIDHSVSVKNRENFDDSNFVLLAFETV
jgi:hypothetical protein